MMIKAVRLIRLALSDLREHNDAHDNTEEVEGEVSEDTEKVVLETIIAVRVHLSNRILHPVEEERVRGLDVVGSLGLLDGKAEEGALIITHETKTRSCVKIVELTAAEVACDTRAAIETNSPEIVRCDGLVANNNWSNTVEVKILETHGVLVVEAGTTGEIHAAGVHQLLSLLTAWVNVWVGVKVLNVIEWLHVVPEVHVTKKGTHSNSNKQSNGAVIEPHTLTSTLLLGAVGEGGGDENSDQTEAEDHPCSSWVLVVERERQHTVDGGKCQPRREDVRADCDEIQALALAAAEHNILCSCALHYIILR